MHKTDPASPSSEKGKIVILVAPSGTGKTTLTRRLMNEFPNLKFSVSATTRSPRKQETRGKDYYFMNEELFQQAVDHKQFLEWEEVYGGIRYGTLISEVENKLQKGYFVLLDIEVKGALHVKTQYGDDALAIFIRPPSDAVLIERLKNRGTENDDALQLRLNRARMELGYAEQFDHVILNDDLDRCYKELSELVASFMKETTTD